MNHFISPFPLSVSLWMHNKHFYIKRGTWRGLIRHCKIQPKLGSLKTSHNSTIRVKLYTIRSLRRSTEGSYAAGRGLWFTIERLFWALRSRTETQIHKMLFWKHTCRQIIHMQMCWAFKPQYCRLCRTSWRGTGLQKCAFQIMLSSEWLCHQILSKFTWFLAS